MRIGDLIYETAKADEGVWEWAKGDNPRVLAYYREAGVPQTNDEVPWCAAFVGAVLARCGVQGTGSLLARSYESWGTSVPLDQAQRGDVVMLSRGQPWQGHVGFYEGAAGGNVTLLGGNQGDQVNITAYPKSRVVAVRRAVEPAALPKRRAGVTESTTVRAAGVQAVAAVGAGLEALRSLDGMAQIVALGVAGLVLVLAMWIARERIRKILAGLG
ncbi:MAG: TIGR02594 family protein [Gammaproteobacteria bacterium SHHR-1]